MSQESVWEKSRVELFHDLDTNENGLTAEEAAARLGKHGPNELQGGEKKSVLRIFLEQFKDFLVIILIAAAVVSAVPSVVVVVVPSPSVAVVVVVAAVVSPSVSVSLSLGASLPQAHRVNSITSASTRQSSRFIFFFLLILESGHG